MLLPELAIFNLTSKVGCHLLSGTTKENFMKLGALNLIVVKPN